MIVFFTGLAARAAVKKQNKNKVKHDEKLKTRNNLRNKKKLITKQQFIKTSIYYTLILTLFVVEE